MHLDKAVRSASVMEANCISKRQMQKKTATAYLHGIIGVSSCDPTRSFINIQSHLLTKNSKVNF